MPTRVTPGQPFPAFTEEDWLALAARSIGVESLASLTATTDDGIRVGPIAGPGSEPPIAGRTAGTAWVIFQRIDNPDIAGALEDVRADLDGGVTGLDLVFGSSPRAMGRGLPSSQGDLERIARAADADGVRVRVDAGEDTPAIAAALFALRKSLAPTVAFDAIAGLAASGYLARPIGDSADAAAELARSYDAAGVGGMVAVADGRPWHDGGASEVQELGLVAAGFVAHLGLLSARGLTLASAVARTGVTLAADADQFVTIAKFRAARLILARILELADCPPGPVRIHGETAWRMLSRRDGAMNLLRATSAAFAAGVGGADSITVLAFGETKDAAFARRMARNTQTILIEEAHVANLADPAAGAGAIEDLTAALAAASWEQFRTIERQGGLLQAIRDGSIQRDIAAQREARMRRVARREIELVGTNVNCDPERLSLMPIAVVGKPSRTGDVAERASALVATRLAEPFEGLIERAAGLAAAGRKTEVPLLALGDPADHADAVNLATDFFAAGGLSVLPSKPAKEFSGRVACVAAGARVSAAEIDAAATAFTAAGARLVLIAAEAGNTDVGGRRHIGPGIDAVALLSQVLDAIAE